MTSVRRTLAFSAPRSGCGRSFRASRAAWRSQTEQVTPGLVGSGQHCGRALPSSCTCQSGRAQAQGPGIQKPPSRRGAGGNDPAGGACQAGVWPRWGVRLGAGPRWLCPGGAAEWTEDAEGGRTGGRHCHSPDTGARCLPHLLSHAPRSQECAFPWQAPGTDSHGAPAQSQGCPPRGPEVQGPPSTFRKA